MSAAEIVAAGRTLYADAPLRAVVYCRISRNPSKDEKGVERQEADCRELCARLGIEVVEVFVDNDISAFAYKHRPGLKAAFEALKSPSIGYLVSYHQERITRGDGRAMEDLIDALQASRTLLHTVLSGEVDLNTSDGRMTFRLVGTIARASSEHKQELILRKHQEKFERGEVGGGSRFRPFGYEDGGLVVIADEAKVIRDMYARVIAGETLLSIARKLNDEGIKTPSAGKITNKAKGTISDGKWAASVIRAILVSGRVAGIRIRTDAEGNVTATAKSVWPAILTMGERARVLAVLNDPSRFQARGNTHYLLTGILRCGICNAKLCGHPGSHAPVYICKKQAGRHGCGKIKINAAHTEAEVIAHVRSYVEAPVRATLNNVAEPDDDGPVLAELAQIDIDSAELGRMLFAPGANRPMLAAAGNELERRRLALNDRLRATVASRARAAVRAERAALGTAWPEGYEAQRAYLGRALEAVSVAPAGPLAPGERRRFDPSRLGGFVYRL